MGLRMLQPKSDDIIVLTELARDLQAEGRLTEAVALFQRVVEIQPDLPLAVMNLGIALCQVGQLEESFAVFRRHAVLTHGAPVKPASIPPYKRAHDAEQRDYLNSLGIKNTFHIDEGKRVTGRAVNPDSSGVAAEWQSKEPQIVVIDNFLTPEALDALRHYCLGSTIWNQAYKDGYLGAMPEDGLGSPLLAQIAEELRTAYPAILGDHPLLQFWGFKYDSQLSGVALHADFAAVNVNFWITPDDANRDPATGGLIVWDKPAPLDWDFERYNDDVGSARDFLTQAGAQSIKIPYRTNRAVIFDSDLFHETDRIDFKEGYLNRRINLTLLYGRREER